MSSSSPFRYSVHTLPSQSRRIFCFSETKEKGKTLCLTPHDSLGAVPKPCVLKFSSSSSSSSTSFIYPSLAVFSDTTLCGGTDPAPRLADDSQSPLHVTLQRSPAPTTKRRSRRRRRRNKEKKGCTPPPSLTLDPFENTAFAKLVGRSSTLLIRR